MLTTLVTVFIIGFALGEKPLKFMHVAKTGGTSIEDWGHAHNYSWGRFDRDMTRGGKNHYPLTFRDVEFQSKSDWFLAVRNPYARIVSMFYHSHNDLFKKHTSPYTVINKTEAEMNAWIQHRLETRIFPKVWWHLADQYLYVSNKNQCRCNITIIYYENLLPDFRAFMHDQSLTLPQSNYHHDKKLSTRNITQETANMIYMSYQEDFRLFGYAREVGAVNEIPTTRLTQDQVPTWDIASEKERMGVRS
jgi:hypothetical protein